MHPVGIANYQRKDYLFKICISTLGLRWPSELHIVMCHEPTIKEQQVLLAHSNRNLGLPFPGSGSPKRSNWLLTKPAHPAGPDAQLLHLPWLHHCKYHVLSMTHLLRLPGNRSPSNALVPFHYSNITWRMQSRRLMLTLCLLQTMTPLRITSGKRRSQL